MTTIVEELREYLRNDLRIAQAAEIEAGQRLLRSGVVDSIEFAQLLAFVERTYKVSIGETEMIPGNVGSLEAIAALVARKRLE